MPLTKSNTRFVAFAIGILICLSLYALYTYKLFDTKPAAWVKRIVSQPSPTSAPGVSDLVADSQRSKEIQDPVEMKCPVYQEFRRLDFLHPALRSRLCRNADAYKRYSDGYPMCELQNPFVDDLLNIIRQNSDIIPLMDMKSSSLPMFVYKGYDYITSEIRRTKSWEPHLAHPTLRFALKVPQATFLDIGSNIGVYSIQAAKLGLPVVSLDANIRNLLRLHLSLNASSLRSTLVWNFIATGQQLRYLSFLADCNVGGAGKIKADLPDTVPVMPMSSERLTSLIKTKNVVIKMDVQGGEPDFFRTSGRLFTDFNVAAVQMEWTNSWISGPDAASMVTFFTTRGYNVYKIPGFQALNAGQSKSWGDIDVTWVHKDFVKML